MNTIMKKYAEAKKAQRKKFGTVTAFILGLAILECFSFSGTLLSLVTSSYLYGIPEYVAFVLVATLAVYASSKTSQLYAEGTSYNQLAFIFIISIGLSLIALQMVMGYLVETGIIEKPYNTSLGFIFAFVFIDEIVGAILTIVPNYMKARENLNRFKRIGIALFSLTALPILFLGWIVSHMIVLQFSTQISNVGPLMTSTLSLGLLMLLIRKIQVYWKNGLNFTHTWVPVTLFIFSLGLLNGAMTGSPNSMQDPLVSSTYVKIVLSAILASQIITVLTIWYLFVMLPYFFSKPKKTSAKS